MPYCPICLSEFREGFTRCNSCYVDLVAELAGEMDLSQDNIQQALEGKELVGITRGTLEVVKETRDILSKHRIASIVVDVDEELPAGMPPRMALVVSKDDLERAIEVLGGKFKEMLDVEGVDTANQMSYDSCPACGKKVTEHMEECPECGLVIGKG
jgi:uncharacterized protein (UPF0212 family)